MDPLATGALVAVSRAEGISGAEIRPVNAWIPLTAQLHADDGPEVATDHDSYNIFDVARLRDAASPINMPSLDRCWSASSRRPSPATIDIAM
jgi:hypothetical protein